MMWKLKVSMKEEEDIKGEREGNSVHSTKSRGEKVTVRGG